MWRSFDAGSPFLVSKLAVYNIYICKSGAELDA